MNENVKVYVHVCIDMYMVSINEFLFTQMIKMFCKSTKRKINMKKVHKPLIFLIYIIFTLAMFWLSRVS